MSAGFSPLNIAIDLASRAPIWIDWIGSVAGQAATADEQAAAIEAGQWATNRERDEGGPDLAFDKIGEMVQEMKR